MLHTILWWLIFAVTTVILSVFSIIAGIFDRTGNTSHKINRFWGSIVMRAATGRIEVVGLENLVRDSGQVLVSNHQSGFDICSLTACIPLQIRWISKNSLFKLPFLGWAMSAARYISMIRENPREAVKSLKIAADYARKGYSIVIFPEGTRSLDGELKEFKNGALYLARKGQLTITPVTIIGTFNIKNKKSFRIQAHPVKIIIDKPIPYADIEGRKEKDVLDDIRNIILENINKNKA